MAVTLTYAIGDIHGCADRLAQLLAEIDRHAAGREHRLVFLGDYIDRGSDSAAVLKLVRSQIERRAGFVTCLKGNHEAMLLDAVRSQDDLLYQNWLCNGGEEAVVSFECEWPDGMPAEVLKWLDELPTVHEDELRYYVHAGFRPGCPGVDPSEKARLWIREPFVGVDFDFGKHVVHGHTPLRDGKPDVRAHRTNLDTGCVFGGKLTAGVFSDQAAAAVDFIQV